MDINGNLMLTLRIDVAGTGYDNIPYGPVDPMISNAAFNTALVAWIQQYAMDNFGTTFDLGDTIYVLNPVVASTTIATSSPTTSLSL